MYNIIYLILTLMAFLKSIVSQPVGRSAHKSVGRFAHVLGGWVLQREVGGGGKVRAEGWRESCYCYFPPPPLRSV